MTAAISTAAFVVSAVRRGAILPATITSREFLSEVSWQRKVAVCADLLHLLAKEWLRFAEIVYGSTVAAAVSVWASAR